LDTGFAENIPGVGQVYSGGKAITGYNPITGQSLGIFEIGLAALGVSPLRRTMHSELVKVLYGRKLT
jgi:hypothetical protein